jgi:hypothetical protein
VLGQVQNENLCYSFYMIEVLQKLHFFSGQTTEKPTVGTDKQTIKINPTEVRLAYTDKHFSFGNFAFSNLVDNALLESKI